MNERDDIQGEDDEQLARRAKQLFDESVDSLDARTLSRLNQSRQAALAKAGSRSGFTALSPWVPAASVAAAAVFAVVLWTGQTGNDQIMRAGTVSDIEILLNEDSLEMLDELEFYSWMDLDIESRAGSDEDSNVG